MSRREFTKAIKVAVVKRAMRDGVVYCESCGLPAKRWQIDHRVADAHGGKPVIENAQLICEPCFAIKNPQDTKIAAKLKRVEARHLGAHRPKAKIKSAGFPQSSKPRIPKPQIAPRALYRS